jgi:hypothetical protein
MRRTLLLLGMIAFVLALAGCGGGDDSSSSSNATGTSGSQGTSGPTGPTAATGTTGTTDASKAKKKSTQRGSASPGSGGGSATQGQAPTIQRGGKKRKLKGLLLNLYNQGKTACQLPAELLVTDYKAKSKKPEDVAIAYARAYIRDPKRKAARQAVYEGCLVSLRKK